MTSLKRTNSNYIMKKFKYLRKIRNPPTCIQESRKLQQRQWTSMIKQYVHTVFDISWGYINFKKSFNPVSTSTFRHVSNDNSEVCQYGDWPKYNSSCAAVEPQSGQCLYDFNYRFNNRMTITESGLIAVTYYLDQSTDVFVMCCVLIEQ